MLISKYSAIIFDLDGTLMTIPVDWDSVRRELRELFGSEEPFVPLFKAIEEKVGGRPDTRAGVFSMIDKYELAVAPKSRLVDGARELLEFVGKRASLALVTMQGRRACEELIERHGLSGRFQATLTREDSLSRSRQLRTAMDKLSASPERTFFVGDRMNDANEARRVNLQVALVGGRRPDDLPGILRFAGLGLLKDYLSGEP